MEVLGFAKKALHNERGVVISAERWVEKAQEWVGSAESILKAFNDPD